MLYFTSAATIRELRSTSTGDEGMKSRKEKNKGGKR
jgi:hypothetical protein